MEEYAKKTARQKYAKSEVYAKFKHGIFVRTYLESARFALIRLPLASRKCNIQIQSYHPFRNSSLVVRMIFSFTTLKLSFDPPRGWRRQRRRRRTRNGWSYSELHLSHHADPSCQPHDFVSPVVIIGDPQRVTVLCTSRKVCGHSFSEEAIRQTFRGSTSVAKKCPASGCNKTFKLTDLTPDAALAKKVRNWNRRNQRAAEHDDAEEIIE